MPQATKRKEFYVSNRTPTSPNGRNVDTDAPTAQHDLTQPLVPQPGDYDPAGPNGLHRHDGEAAGFHRRGDEPHYHDPTSGIVVFFDPSASDRAGAGWFDAAVSGENQSTADLVPAAATDAAAAPGAVGGSGRDGHAGTGRPLPPRGPDGKFVSPAWGGLLVDVDLRLEDLDAQAAAVEANCYDHADLVTDTSLAVFDAEVEATLTTMDDLAELLRRQDACMAFADAAAERGLATAATAYCIAGDRVDAGGGS
jgi:hypothetical protein